MKRTELSPDLLIPHIKKRISELQITIEETQIALKNPEKGHLRISRRGNTFNHYIIHTPKDTHGKYLPKKLISVAQKIAQRDYDSKILQEMQIEVKLLQNLLNNYKPDSIQRLWEKQSQGRKKLITPVQLPISVFISNWLSLPNPGNPFNTEDKVFQTAAGIYVRSKSELLIANILYAHHIPFHYEKPLQFKSGKTIYPDFTCLNTTTQQTILWEHFGLMDNSEYAEKAVFKIYQLQKEGYIMGKNFLATFETKDTPLTPQKIEMLVKEFFFDNVG